MSPSDSLYEIVHAQFREAFGHPHTLLGGGEQWTLQPASDYKSGIHVLLNGTPEKPGVWVFDPYDRNNGVQNTAISERCQISELITVIQGRLKVANGKRNDIPRPPLSGSQQA